MKKLNITLITMTAFVLTAGQESSPENISDYAEKMIKNAYLRSITNQDFALFHGEQKIIAKKKDMFIPTTQEIVTKVGSLQDEYGKIQHQQAKELALQALQASDQAITKALKKLNSKSKKNLLAAEFHAKVAAYMQAQQTIIQIKIKRISNSAVWQHLTDNARLYLATGLVIAAGGLTAYYYLHQPATLKKIHEFTNSGITPANVYKRLSVELLQLLDLNHKFHPMVHLDTIRESIGKLNPETDKDLMELLEVIAQAQDRQPVDSFVNLPFWAKVGLNRNRYIATIINLLNSDAEVKSKAPNGIAWTADDIDFQKIMSEKNNFPTTRSIERGIVRPAISASSAQPVSFSSTPSADEFLDYDEDLDRVSPYGFAKSNWA